MSSGDGGSSGSQEDGAGGVERGVDNNIASTSHNRFLAKDAELTNG